MENNQKEIVLLKDLGTIYINNDNSRKHRMGIYLCSCGKEFTTKVYSIKSGRTKSCGHCNHNLTNHRLYKIWVQMKTRCRANNNYVEKNIKVCDEWLKVENFINDMYPTFQEGLTLDREDNDLGYNKSNCRWTTREVQNRNTRKIQKNNTSGYRGVTFDKRLQKWCAVITVNCKSIFLGRFSKSIDAGIAYDNYVIANNLEHTKNF